MASEHRAVADMLILRGSRSLSDFFHECDVAS